MTAAAPYERCLRLFAGYPLAVRPKDPGGSAVELVLMTADGKDPRFFLLIYDSGDGRPYCLLNRLGTEDSIDIEPGQRSVPPGYAAALTHGIPVPRDGSMFGWVSDGEITALITVDSRDAPEPRFSTMPRAGIPETRWPPFTGAPCLGMWLWEHLTAGRMIDLAPAVAATWGQVFFCPARIPGAGAGVIAVKAALSPEPPRGWILPSGVYAYHGALRSGARPESLSELLAGHGKTDLGPRFTGWDNSRGRSVDAALKEVGC